MTKPKLGNKKMEILIRKSFPKAIIQSMSQFKTGLVSPTFKIKIKNPNKIIVMKLSRLRKRKMIEINNNILKYLDKNNFPVPHIFFSGVYDKKYVTIMEFIEGKIAKDFFKNSSEKQKRNLLKNSGKMLRKMHKLNAPSCWKHSKHEIKTEQQWKNWTRQRKNKYLKFIEGKRAFENEKLKKVL